MALGIKFSFENQLAALRSNVCGGGLSVRFGCLVTAIRWPFVTTVRALPDLR